MNSLWRLAFRPFFFLAAVFAVVSILVWISVFSGYFRPPGGWDPILWHSHEMIYGYVTAVIAGFVLTAVQNWTGIRGVNGMRLIFLGLLWLAARMSLGFASGPSIVVAAVDLSFYPVLAIFLYPYLRSPEMKVERIFFLYFALYLAGNLLMHLESLGMVQGYALRGARLGLYTTVLMIIFMGGRVIPFFTESSVARSQPVTRSWVEIPAHLFSWAFLVTQWIDSVSIYSAVCAFIAGAVHLLRLAGWQVRRNRRAPLIWVLHVSYLWIILGFSLTGFASLGWLATGQAVHAFAVGGVGGMILGMISRVSLGHTGRRLHPHLLTVVAYYLLNAAAVVRVFGPLLLPSSYIGLIQVSGLLWAGALALFLAIYTPILFSARVDGRDG